MDETSPISVDHHSIMRKMPADETSSASITRVECDPARRLCNLSCEKSTDL
jgi:hypothetical protein